MSRGHADPGAALAALVGTPHVLEGAAAAAFAIDGRAPRWVVCPGSVEEVGRCLALAAEAGLAVAPLGWGTRRHWGNPPRALDLVLSLRRLDRVLAHEPADLTLSVEAGARLGAVQAHLRAFRQCLPLDPAHAADSTVGGLLATAAAGPYRARYGTLREMLLGVTAVRADGTVIHGGGRVVKNVTGYDTPKLIVGALGTLAVVVAAHLRLHPAPPVEATWLLACPAPEAALEAALAVMDAPLVVSRLQFLDRPTLAWLGAARPPGAALAVAIGSVAEAVRAQGERVAELGRAVGARVEPVPAPEDWWRRVSDATWPPEPTSLTLRVGTRPTDLVKALRTVEAAAGDAGVRATAEVPSGVLHLVLAGAGVAAPAALVSRVRAGLQPLGASCVVEHAPPAAKATLDVWGDVGPALDLMRRLKAELDPQGVLNPGRYVGGI